MRSFPVVAPALAVFAVLVVASPNAQYNLVSEADILKWLETTTANVTYLSPKPDLKSKRSAATTSVVYCNKIVGNTCDGQCTYYTGGPTCLNAPGTNCLMANQNVQFCNKGGCNSGTCHQLDNCGTRLNNNYCATPGTNSIKVFV